MTYPVLAWGLLGFWLLLSGHFTPLLLTLGAASVLLTLAAVRRLERAQRLAQQLRPTWRLLPYLLWLFGKVLRANIAVARRILDPRLPISPSWQAIDSAPDSPNQLTLYANSVTLTPDTLTTGVDAQGRLMVHALWPECIEALRDGEMQRRIRGTGI